MGRIESVGLYSRSSGSQNSLNASSATPISDGSRNCSSDSVICSSVSMFDEFPLIEPVFRRLYKLYCVFDRVQTDLFTGQIGITAAGIERAHQRLHFLRLLHVLQRLLFKRVYILEPLWGGA